MIAKQRTAATGFTLTEFLVLIGIGSVLAGVLAADLSQARTKLFQQACAANMKHWGMAFDMYAQDYNNRLYNNAMGLQWDDSGTPYWRYLGETNSNITIRNMRICPARMGKTDFSTTHSYSMPIGTYKKGLAYADADSPVSPFGNIFGYFPSLRFLPEPSSFLLLIEGRANVVRCGGLVLATTLLHTGSGGDTIPAIDRHGGGGVNCLFGDFHVEFVSSQVLTNQDAVSCPAGNPWFMLN